VIVISSFSPPDENCATWIKAMDDGFAKLKSSGITKLIIDLSNNLGGATCMGTYFLTRFGKKDGSKLIPKKPLFTNMRVHPSLIRISEKLPANYDGNIFSRLYWQDKDGVKYSSANWTEQSQTFVQSGREVLYSNNILDICDSIITKPGVSYDGYFDPNNVVVLTNGYCGSACAVVAAHLFESYGFQTMVTTIKKSAFDPAVYSFAGGQAYDSDTMLQITSGRLSMLHDPLIPGPFPTRATLYFTVRQVFSEAQKMKPLEYSRLKAQYYLPLNPYNSLRPAQIWASAAALVKWIKDNQLPWPCCPTRKVQKPFCKIKKLML